MLLTREEAKRLLEKILGLSKLREVAVSLHSSQNCNTRFANNAVTTAGFTESLAIDVTVTRERRSGSARTSETTEAALADTVRRAEAIAETAPADPEYVAPLGPQPYPEIQAFYQESARARSAQLLPAVKTVIRSAMEKKVNSFGYYDVTTEAQAVATKQGLFGYHRHTWADYSVTARTPDGTGSGWAQDAAPALSRIQPDRVGATAIEKCLTSQNPQPLDPGRYTVILEPAALQEMLQFLAFSLGARAADEGRSFLSKAGGGNRKGEKVFGENVTLLSDPFHPRTPGFPWSGGGGFLFGGGGAAGGWIPAEKTVWIEKGVVKNLFYDRYWAERTEQKPTPFPTSVIMEGSTATREELIRSTERGLLVTRFWYIRFLQPQTVQLTGLTRDGLFYIEKGKIKNPVMNFRWNESVVHLLNSIEAMTPAVPVGNDVLPTVKVREFNFSSLSDAV
jgi:predicted Zn-dependent protease